ncbi:hypothetical protein F0266_11965 [Vibrio coralliilyticus]|uniref:hypothetical protein n=1 Tax=Vibrio coralliilyticus TaxID=190893 RepID=UPI00148CF50B|nr:hypothetical protein [Vibrio coralliilyticus]NOH53653.1 hypothetical protein [Vibrio coralliilyticus]
MEKLTNRDICSLSDFGQALSAVQFIREETDYFDKSNFNRKHWRRLRCYESAMILSFSRAFKVGGRKRKVFDIAKFGITLNKEEELLKSRVFAYRDKVIAHSDEESMSFVTDAISFDGTNVVLPRTRNFEVLYFSYEEIEKIEALTIRFHDALLQYIFEFANKYPEDFKKHQKPKQLTGNGMKFIKFVATGSCPDKLKNVDMQSVFTTCKNSPNKQHLLYETKLVGYLYRCFHCGKPF